MKQSWLNNTLPIAAIYAFRMLGLFMLIPVFTVYASDLRAATPALIGVALGGYGLSQGILQIPFGMLSDKYGRKPLLVIGLGLFTLGSVLGIYTHSIYGMILARILQGSGAIGSVLMALLADVTPDEHRTKAMAVIGITIGVSFGLAMIISPIMAHHGGLSAIFLLTTLLAVIGMLMIYVIIPSPKPSHIAVDKRCFKDVITDRRLLRLDAGIFIQHLTLTSTFFAVPLLLKQHVLTGQLTQQWSFYLPLMLLSFLIMLPSITWAEKKQKIPLLYVISIAGVALSQWVLAFTYPSFSSLCLWLFIYFVAFNHLEAILPSLVSKQVTQHNRGSAMGVYSSSQFLGIFAGGALSGLLFQWAGFGGIFIINGCLTLIWLLWVIKTNTPHQNSLLPNQ